MASGQQSLSGGCLCGAVRFTATPESADSKATSSASEALSPSTPP